MGFGIGELVALAISSIASLEDVLSMLNASMETIFTESYDGASEENDQELVDFEQVITSAQLNLADIPCISGSTGGWVDVQVIDGDWLENINENDFLYSGLEKLLNMRCWKFLELSAEDLLGRRIKAYGKAKECVVVSASEKVNTESEINFLINDA